MARVTALWVNREKPAVGRSSLFTAASAIQSTRPRLASPAILETGRKRFPCPDVWRCATIGRVEYNMGSFIRKASNGLALG